MNTVSWFPYITEKPKNTGVKFQGKNIYTFLGKFYVKSAAHGYNALEGFKEIRGVTDLVLTAN